MPSTDWRSPSVSSSKWRWRLTVPSAPSAPGSQEAVLVGSNLEAPPAGKVYELWYIPSKDAAPAPAGTFQPDAGGSVLMKTTVGGMFVALAVSVEPPGGSTTPTKVILIRNV